MTLIATFKTYDLGALNLFVEQQEKFLRGRLVSIGNDGQNTLIEIDDDCSDKPIVNSLITIGIPPAGAMVIQAGLIFLSGTPTIAIAYRPAAHSDGGQSVR